MRIIADLPDSVAARIRDLVFRGRYESSQSFLLAAVENQLALEATPEAFGVRALADTAGLLQRPPNAPQILQDAQASTQPLDGMVNRFLPVKLGARVLASLLVREDRDSILRRDFEATAAEAAREYGLFLLDLDTKVGRKRGERLSTGLPVGPRQEKSKKRYIQCFLCGDGQGALAALAMCARARNVVGEEVVGLTRAGVEFAMLESPVLDQGRYAQALGAAEVDYLLRHIAANVKGEAEAMRSVLAEIAKGRGEQAALVEFLGRTYGLSGGALGQMAAGLLARMRELGVVQVEGAGPRAVYREGPAAAQFRQSAD